MRFIVMDEHYTFPELSAASAPRLAELGPNYHAAYAHEIADGSGAAVAGDPLGDLGEARLADMDLHGISMQILSCLWAQQAPAPVAAEVVGRANDSMAQATHAHPKHYAAFAALPTAQPEAAVRELERCVREFGFVGAYVSGRTDGDFLSAPRFDPLLATAARLGVPISLGVGLPQRGTTADNYSGLPEVVAGRLQASAWGWHVETAVHCLHLILSGAFDRHPDLQVVIGHWGELIPFYLDRLSDQLPVDATKLDRSIDEYFQHNVYVHSSGMYNQRQLDYCVDLLGAERILYSTDYPFVGHEGAVDFLASARLSEADKHLIAHGNAEKLFGL